MFSTPPFGYGAAPAADRALKKPLPFFSNAQGQLYKKKGAKSLHNFGFSASMLKSHGSNETLQGRFSKTGQVRGKKQQTRPPFLVAVARRLARPCHQKSVRRGLPFLKEHVGFGDRDRVRKWVYRQFPFGRPSPCCVFVARSLSEISYTELKNEFHSVWVF